MTRIGWTIREIGLRHTPRKTRPIRLKPLLILACGTWLPLITATIKPFLSNKGHSAEDVENISSLVQINHSTSDALVPPMPRCIFLIWRYSWNLLVFSSFLTVSIKCCRAGDGITLLAALLVLHRLLSIKSLSSTMLSQRCLTFVPEVIYRWWWTINCISPGLMPLHTQRHQHRNVFDGMHS